MSTKAKPSVHSKPRCTRSPNQDAHREGIQILRPRHGVELQYIHNSLRHWTVVHTSYDICGRFGEGCPVRWRYRHNDLLLDHRNVAMLPPGELHQTLLVPQPTNYVVLLLEPKTLRTMLDERQAGGLDTAWPNGIVQAPVLLSSLSQLWSTAQLDDGGLAFDECLERFIDRTLGFTRSSWTTGTTPTTCLPGLKRAREYIHQHSSVPLSLRDCAAAAELTPWYLCHAFKAKFGLSIREYHRSLRISSARDLLRRQLRPVDVAVQLAFCDQAHFTRTFERELGLLPSHYRIPPRLT